MYEFLSKGGILMIPLIICSVISLTVFFERLWALTRGRVAPAGFLERLLPLFGECKYSEAHLLCQENNTPLARIVDVVARYGERGRLDSMGDALDEQGRQETSRLVSDIEIVGTIAAITPLLGLLGTVLGMIKVFKRVEDFGVGDPTILANGIWEALITTAAGLSVAIPAFLFYKYLQTRVDALTLELEAGTRKVVETLPLTEDCPAPAEPAA